MAAEDRLLAIDGVPTRNMTDKELIKRLRGPVGTSVSIVVARAGEQRMLQLIRAALTRVAPDRLAGLSRSLAALQDLAGSTREAVAEETDRVGAAAGRHVLKKAIDRLATDFPDRQAVLKTDQPTLLSAFDRLAKDLSDRLTALNGVQAQAVSLSREALSGRPEALGLFDRFVELLPTLTKAPEDTQITAHLMELDQEIDEFERINGAEDFDARLLELTGYFVGTINQARMELTWQERFVKKSRDRAKNARQPDEIQETLASLSRELDRWRARLATDPGKMEALEESQTFFENYVKLLLRLELHGEALAASEAARARAFLDLLVKEHTERADSDAEPIAALAQLEEIAKRQKIPGVADAPKLDEILTLVQQTRTTVLEYFVLDEMLLVWVIVPAADGEQAKPVVHLRCTPRGRENLKAAVDNWQQLMADLSKEGVLDSGLEVSTALRDLYRLLIEPVADLLPGRPEQTVTIVPHHGMFSIPFAALARPDASGQDRYLVEDHALAYVPSLGVLKQVEDRAYGRNRDEPPKLLAVVNPKFPPELKDRSGKQFEPLDGMEAQIKYILRFYEPEMIRVRELKGSNATPEKVITEAEKFSPDVILFATHAEADPKNPAASYVALAGRGKLRIEDLDKHQLSARLVILAACETGLGRESSDGVEGIGRAMVAAGADALIVTLWKVPDLSTMQLLYKFHRSWSSEGKGMAQALREAQLGLLETYPVRNWAGFEIIGGEQ